MKLSIIIPVYNVEKYLDKCLSSCVNQDISKDEYEIVIINDGSPDDSINIATRYAKEYKNVYVYSQDNGGLSLARNFGLTKAQGDYVWFVDSDDWIKINCLKSIVAKLYAEDLDLLQLGYYLAYDDGHYEITHNGWFEGVMSGIDVIKRMYIPAPAQFTIYRRSLLLEHSLEFYPHIYHEDSEFKPRVIYFAKRYSCLNDWVYFYFQRPTGSIMSTYKVKHVKDMVTVCKNLQLFMQKNDMQYSIKKEYNYIITIYLHALFSNIEGLDKKNYEIAISILKENKSVLYSLLGSKKLFHKINAIILLMNINAGITFFRFVRTLLKF